MNELLLNLLGTRANEAGSVVSARLEFHPAVGTGLIVGLALLAIAVAVLSYIRRDVELRPVRRGVLLAFRILALLTIVGLLLRPGLGLSVEGMVRQTLILLLDQSASLALRDPRTDTADQVRAGIADGRLPADQGLNQTPPPNLRPTRIEVLQAVLTNSELALVERLGRDFDLKAMGFAGRLVPLQTTERSPTNANDSASANVRARQGLSATAVAASVRAEGRETAIGAAIREVLDQERGRPLGGVVVFTDGINNAGPDARETAELAREQDVAIHVVALGTTRPRDLQVVELSAAEVAFVRDEVQVQVRLNARGLAGSTLPVTLTLDGVRVDGRDVRIEEDGPASASLKFTPEHTGDFVLEVEVPARPDEILAENNRQSRRLRVVDDRIRVLLVEQSPRWEFRYLQALLLRDRRVDLKCVLFDGDPAIGRSPGSPYLEAFPTRREDLFGYDLILWGDVDPRNVTPSQMEFVADFVARSGGSFLMIAGRRFSPWNYRDTPIERLLPVDFDRLLPEPAAGSLHDQPIKPVLTPAGQTSALLRLHDDPEENLRRWNALAPLFWVAPVGRAKPAAQVLAVHDKGDGDESQVPLIALQQYGVGRVMYVGTDNTWRWRRNEGEAFFVSFWGRAVQQLAIHHLVSGSRQTQITLDRSVAMPGERIAVSARLFTSAFEPLAEAVVAATVESLDGDMPRISDTGNTPPRTRTGPTEVMLRAVPDRPGLFHGELVGPAPGRYRLRMGEEAPAAVDFTIEERLVEAGETAMQEELMREVVSRTGGNLFREEDLHRLPEVARSKAERVLSRLTIDLWSSPLYYLGILFLLGCEWALRKWWQLK